MKQITVSILAVVLLVALCHGKSLVDYRLALSKVAPAPVVNCTSGGRFCESCSSLAVCIQNSDDTWTKTDVQTCKSGQKCIKGACTSDPDPFCDGVADLAFPCREVGIFPDPFYCNKFVMCVQINKKLTPQLYACDEGLGYNIATGLCDIKLENGACTVDQYPIPLCQNAGDTGALPDRPTEYYTCDEYTAGKNVLYPVIDVCPNAGHYDNYVCSSQ